MKIHLVTVGEPKLPYARAGWDDYLKRLRYYHTIQVTHIADKRAYDAAHLLRAAGGAYKMALVINGAQLTSPEFAALLEKRSLEAREVCFLIGGPKGLPQAVVNQSDLRFGLSKLTFPHDLAMVVLAEAIYRASTITAGHPYHK